MTEIAPDSWREYEDRFKENVRVEVQRGQSMICIPCPFCAARDWYVVPVDEVFHSSSALYCVECERSARFERGNDALELVQIAGDNAPGWLPKIRHENPPVVVESAGRLPSPGLGRHALRARPTAPPNLHRTKSKKENCHMCVHINQESGLCEKYNWQVERDEVCDSFEPRS